MLLHLAFLGAFGRAVATTLRVLGVVVLGAVVLGAEVFSDFGRIDVISVLIGFVGSR